VSGNSWAADRNWEGNVYQLTPMLMQICRQLELLDHALDNLMMVQHDSWGYQYHERVTPTKLCNLVLDKHCPWEETQLAENVMSRHMQLPVAAICFIHLSAPATIAYQYHQAAKNERVMIKLIVLAEYQNSFNRYYHLGTVHHECLFDSNKHPSHQYYKIAMEQYEVAFGDVHIG
jgi:hypothetical protein